MVSVMVRAFFLPVLFVFAHFRQFFVGGPGPVESFFRGLRGVFDGLLLVLLRNHQICVDRLVGGRFQVGHGCAICEDWDV
jgi:hypothetical protein